MTAGTAPKQNRQGETPSSRRAGDEKRLDRVSPCQKKELVSRMERLTNSKHYFPQPKLRRTIR